MKKIASIFIGLLCFITALAYAETIKITNNSSTLQMMVTYAICPLSKKPSQYSSYCDPNRHLILHSQETNKITVDNFAFYIKVKKVIAQDNMTMRITALGDFPREEDCKGFVNHSIILNPSQNSPDISCEREQ